MVYQPARRVPQRDRRKENCKEREGPQDDEGSAEGGVAPANDGSCGENNGLGTLAKMGREVCVLRLVKSIQLETLEPANLRDTASSRYMPLSMTSSSLRIASLAKFDPAAVRIHIMKDSSSAGLNMLPEWYPFGNRSAQAGGGTILMVASVLP